MTTNLPRLSAPAERALAVAGVLQLEDLINFTKKEVAGWHGVGPNALKLLEQALKKNKRSIKHR